MSEKIKICGFNTLPNRVTDEQHKGEFVRGKIKYLVIHVF